MLSVYCHNLSCAVDSPSWPDFLDLTGKVSTSAYRREIWHSWQHISLAVQSIKRHQQWQTHLESENKRVLSSRPSLQIQKISSRSVGATGDPASKNKHAIKKLGKFASKTTQTLHFLFLKVYKFNFIYT